MTTPDCLIMLSILAIAWLVPQFGLVLYLQMDTISTPLLSAGRRVIRVVEAAVFEVTAPQDLKLSIKAEQEYQDLQAELILIRGHVASAIGLEKNLESEHRRSFDRAERLIHRANQDAANETLREEAKLAREQFLEIERDLQTHRSIVRKLRENLTRQESNVQNKYVEKQRFIATQKANYACKRAHQSLKKLGLSVRDTSSLFKRLEAIVFEHEQTAARTEVNIQLPDHEIEKLDKRSIEVAWKVIDSAVEDFTSIILAVETTQNDLNDIRCKNVQGADLWHRNETAARDLQNEGLEKQASEKVKTYLDSIVQADRLIEELDNCKVKLAKSRKDLALIANKFQARLQFLNKQDQKNDLN